MTTIAVAELTNQLRQLNDWHRNGLYDFVLTYGREFAGQPLPPSVSKGQEQQCFSNAYQLCRDNPERYTYYEGYGLRASLGIHVEHAWAVDQDGNVIERTWRDPEECVYLGVPFEIDFVSRHLLQVGVYGILGNHWMIEGLPLFAHSPVFDDEGRICDYGEG